MSTAEPNYTGQYGNIARLVRSYGAQPISDDDGAPTRKAAAGEAVDALKAIVAACQNQSGLPSDFLMQLIELKLTGKY